MKTTLNSPFENRYVAFVDILGFRDLIRRMPREPELFDIARSTLDQIDHQVRSFRDYRRQKRTGARSVLSRPDLQMSAFSDCYVGTAAWRVVAAVQALGATLLTQSIASRGAVVFGEAYHRGRVLFGPAIVKAYELERDVAKYPRVLVEAAVKNTVWNYHLGRWRGRLLQQDIDGCWFINVLTPSLSNWQALPGNRSLQNRRRFLRAIRGALKEQLSMQRDERQLSKWMWLAHWFNEEVEDEADIEILDLTADDRG